MAREPLSRPVLPISPGAGPLHLWGRDMVKTLTNTLDRIVRRANDAVLVSDAQTITGRKTFEDALEVFDIFAGARFRQLSRGGANPQPSTENSDVWITTTGAITIPNTANGWRAVIQLGGNHDITFNGLVCDVSAEGWGTGDILFAMVQSSTVCKIWRLVAAADLGSFS